MELLTEKTYNDKFADNIKEAKQDSIQNNKLDDKQNEKHKEKPEEQLNNKVVKKQDKSNNKIIKVKSDSKSNSSTKKIIQHVAYIGGPILFTAPHSKKVYRASGKDYEQFGVEESIHAREYFTGTLAMRWALESQGSFCIWGKDSKLNKSDTDPNYMIESKKLSSPFHQTLHQFLIKNSSITILHIDVHGKK